MAAERLLEGVNVKMVLVESWVIVPTIPGASVNELGLMVEMFIGSLKVAVTAEFGQAVVEPGAGVTAMMVGAG